MLKPISDLSILFPKNASEIIRYDFYWLINRTVALKYLLFTGYDAVMRKYVIFAQICNFCADM